MAKKPKLKVVENFRCPPNERDYFRSLHRMLDDIYFEATNHHDMTWQDLAVKANCTYVTVKKLGLRETRYPRYHTVFKLAKAVGWHIVITSGKVAKKPKMKAAG